MKIRWTARRLRLRLDDLEVAALRRGEAVTEALAWPELGWRVELRAGETTGLQASGGTLSVVLAPADLAALDVGEDGLSVEGPVRVRVEKDYRPEHTR